MNVKSLWIFEWWIQVAQLLHVLCFYIKNKKENVFSTGNFAYNIVLRKLAYSVLYLWSAQIEILANSWESRALYRLVVQMQLITFE